MTEHIVSNADQTIQILQMNSNKLRQDAYHGNTELKLQNSVKTEIKCTEILTIKVIAFAVNLLTTVYADSSIALSV